MEMAVPVQSRPAVAGIETALVGPNRAWFVESDMDLSGRFAAVGFDIALAAVAGL